MLADLWVLTVDPTKRVLQPPLPKRNKLLHHIVEAYRIQILRILQCRDQTSQGEFQLRRAHLALRWGRDQLLQSDQRVRDDAEFSTNIALVLSLDLRKQKLYEVQDTPPDVLLECDDGIIFDLVPLRIG
jgi:hypothetical protein